jgi:glyoxylase-like metal-dependent hydrolase (beta-lactamase superfamily II)
LLDTGLGFEKDGKLQIHRNLADAGINPSDITKVLLTHLHKDHAGGVSFGTNHDELSFPNALFYLQEKELSFAFEKDFLHLLLRIRSIKKIEASSFIKRRLKEQLMIIYIIK